MCDQAGEHPVVFGVMEKKMSFVKKDLEIKYIIRSLMIVVSFCLKFE